MEIPLPYLLHKEIMVVMEIALQQKNQVVAAVALVVPELLDLILE